MNTKNHKETSGRKKNKRHCIKLPVTYRSIDWNLIENTPKTRLHREILKKITSPSPLDLAIKDEDALKLKKVIFNAIRYGGLTYSERECVKLEFEGLGPLAIAKKLAIGSSAVKSYLERGKKKILKCFQHMNLKSVRAIKKSILAD